MTQQEIAELQRMVASARNILILSRRNPTVDGIAAGLALYLSLIKMGKDMVIACPDELTVNFGSLIAVDKIVSKIEGKNLVVSLDYSENSIEKVSYNIEGSKFNLVITPKQGAKPLSAKNVSYGYGGIQADLVFLLETQNFNQLNGIYAQDQKLFSTAPTVNIDYHGDNSKIGKINIVDTFASSVSELILRILNLLKAPLDGDIAANILAGIISATDNFQKPNTSATAFEAAGYCLRAGAKRIRSAPAVPVRESMIKPEEKPFIPEETPSDWLEPKIFKAS